MYRTHRLAPFASFLLLTVIVVVLALGSASEVTAETAGPSVPAAASDLSAAPSADPDVVKELVDKRTENSRTYLLKDGRLKSVVYDGPIQFKDEKGNWQTIDISLVPAKDGGYVSAATPVKVSLSLPTDAAPVVSLDYQGASLELTLKDQVFASPQVEGSTASYPASEPAKESTTTDIASGPVEETTTTDTASGPVEGTTTTETASGPVEESTTTDTTSGPAEPTTTTATTLGPVEESTTTVTTSGPVEESTTTDTTASPVETTTTTEPAKTPEVTLSYQVLAAGVKEIISLASAKAPSSYTFTLDHPGLTLWQDQTGTWGLYHLIEEPPVFVLGGLDVHDSSLNDLGDPAFCADAAMTLTPGTDRSTATITVPQKWLADPERRYPVLIDPSIYTENSSEDTYVRDNYPTSSYGTNTEMRVGYADSTTGRSRALIKFALPAAVTNSYVQSATLQLHQVHQWATGAREVRVAQMTRDWTETSTYNSIGTGYDLPYAKYVWSTGQSAQYFNFDFADVVQVWADGAPNYGFVAYTEGGEYLHYRRLDSKESGDITFRPQLTIYYTEPKDVTAYGADGTDLLDDTAAFQAAIDAVDDGGGVVRVPAGDYYLSGLHLDGAADSEVILRGDGTSTVLLPKPDTAIADMILMSGTAAVSNVTLKDFYLRLPAGGNGIKIGPTGGSGITLTGLTLGGGADSSINYGVSGTTNLTNLTLTNLDLSGVTALPMSFPNGAGGTSVSGTRLPYEPYRADALQGSEGYDTALRLSKAAYPDTAPAVVIVPGDSFVDALSAAPLAKAYGGPVLLTPSTGLDSRVQAELWRLDPARVFVVGLSTTVWWQVQHALPSTQVTQLSGTDRYDTAAKVAVQIKAQLGTPSKVVIVSDGNAGVNDDFSGLAAAALAAKNGWPILLTDRDAATVNSTTYNCYKNQLGVNSAIRVGTTTTLTGITGTITTIGVATTDNCNLAGLVADYAVGNGCSYSHTGLASGASYADTLALGAYLGRDGGILLFTNGQAMHSVAEAKLQANYGALDRLTYVSLLSLWGNDQNSNVWIPSAVSHTTYDLGSFAGHSSTAVLNKSRLEMETTDLAIASFGPGAALSRHYSSARTTAGAFAPGWRFSFEQKLDLTLKDSGGRIDYIDEAGETYIFLKNGSQWLPQPGFVANLRADGTNWKLTAPAGNTLTLDSTGKLLSEADPNGNTVTYTWSGATVTSITATNGQQMNLTWTGSKLTGASYQTADGNRTLTFSAAAPWTVTYFPGVTGLARSAAYTYTSDRLTELKANAFTALGDSTEQFGYTGTALTGVLYPDYSTNADACTGIAYNGQAATVTTHGQIYSSGDVDGTSGTPVYQIFTWNASGTMATKTNPKLTSTYPDAGQTWSYTYSPYTNLQLTETSPLGKTKSWTYNNRGNVTTETDEAAHTTTYEYPDKDPGVPGFVDVQVSADAQDCYDANTTLHKTDYYYQAIGRGTAVDKAGWRFTNIQVPTGASITYAALYVAAYDSPWGNPALLETKLGLEDADNPGDWTAGAHEPRLATMTSAYVANWRPTTTEWKAGKWVASPDLKSSVQEVIDRPGWAKGHAMCVVWADNGTPAGNLLNTFDKKSGAGAHLVIYYTRNLDPDPGRDIPKRVTGPGGRVTETYLDDKGNIEKLRTKLNDAEWAETQYTYADVQVGSKTYYGAMTEQKKLATGTPETGTWAVTDLDSDGYHANGQPKKTVAKNVVLQDAGTPVDLTVSTTVDAFGNLLTKTDPSGQVVQTNTYNLAGRLLTSTGALFTATVGSPTTAQLTARHFYDPWGHETESYGTSSADATTKASWTTTVYDKAGRASVATSKLTSGTVQSTTTLAYDGLGRQITFDNTTVSGLAALSAYDASGNVVASWAEGACSGSYDLAKAARVVDANNNPAYDVLGRKTRALSAGDTNSITYTYYDDSRVKKETKPDGSWVRFYYDPAGNVIHTLDSVLHAAYPAEDEDNPTHFLTTSVYDLGGRCTASTNASNFETDFVYDLLGRVTSAGAHGQSASSFTYSTLGWKLKVQDADGFTSTYVFDNAGRTLSEATAGYTTTYTYQSPAGGGVGLLWKKTEGASDREAICTYDYFGRTITEVQTSGGVTVKNVSASYDSLGRVTSSSDTVRNLTHTFTYPVNAPGSATDAAGVGSGGNLVTTTLTLGPDMLEASRNSVVAGSPQITALRTVNTRDAAQRLTKATIDTSVSATGIYAQYKFDEAGHLVGQWGIGTWGSLGTTGSGYLNEASRTQAYTYSTTSGLKTNENLQLMSVGSAGTISSSYTYNSAGRLISAATNSNPSESFTYDPSGNIQTAGSTTFSYQTGSNLLDYSTGGYARYYFFDAAGKWRTLQAPTNSQSDPNRETFAYTGTGRLQTYTKYSSGSPSLTGTYTYDAQGQRTKSVVALAGGLATTTEFAYSGLLLQSLSASQTGTGATSWKITYLYDEYGRPYGGVYRSPATSTSPVFFAMVTTDRGDVVELLDATGNPFAAYRYDAWGNPQGSGTDNDGSGLWYQTTGLITSSTLAKAIASRQPLRYASYCFDSESGMYYLSSRHYDPATRQFLSKDLSRNDGEQSAYQYCLGNPVGGTDPTGYAVVREQDRPLTPQQRAAMRNRVMEARWKWYQNLLMPKQSMASRVFGYLSYLNPKKAVGKLVSYVANKINKPVGVAVDLFTGAGDRERYYGASAKETQQMMGTMNVQREWARFQANGSQDRGFGYPILEALDETVFGADGGDIPFTNTPAQVGGYAGATIDNNGDGTATVTIKNEAGLNSFFYHLLPNAPNKTGSGATIYQTFEWTWPLDYQP